MSDFDDLKSEIIYSIYSRVRKTRGQLTSTLSEIQEMLPEHCISGLTRGAIESLTEDGFLVLENRNYYVSQVAIRSIEYDLSEPNSLIYRLASDDAALAYQSAKPSIPAADRIVTLDHNSDPYKKAVRALDEAVAAFKEDRLLENEWGSEKGVLLRTLAVGRELLEEGQLRVATAFSTIVAPLQIIREHYNHAIIAGLVTAGADQLIHTIGHAISSLLALLGIS
jgi:hypothetical protein